MTNLKQKTIYAFAWDFIGKIGLQGIGFIISIFLARLLSPSDFGLIAMVMVIIGIAGIFLDVGLGGALIQRSKLLPVHYSSVFFFNLSIAVIMTLITFFSAPYIAEFYKNKELIPITHVISIIFILNALNGVHIVILRKSLNFKAITKITFFASLSGGVVGVLMAFKGFGVWSLVAQQIVSGVMGVILVWNFSKWRPSFQFSFKALKQLWKFGFNMFLSTLIESVVSRLDYMMIGKFFNATILGFYQRAKSLDMLVINYASGSLMSVLFPVLSKIKNDLPRFQKVIIKSFGIICFVTFFLLGWLFLISKELIVLLFSVKWLPSVEIFKILVLSGFAYPISALLVNVLSSRGKSGKFLQLEIYKKVSVIVNLSLLPFFGVMFYLYGRIVVAFINVFLNIVFASKEIKLSKLKFIKPLIIQMFLTLIITFVIYKINYTPDENMLMSLVIKSIEFFFLYLLVNFLLKTEPFIYFYEQIKQVFKIKGMK